MGYLKSNQLFDALQPEALYRFTNRPVVIGDQLTDYQNIGALIRLSDNLGVKDLFFLGEEPVKQMTKIRRIAASSHGNLNWTFSREMEIRKLVAPSAVIVALETAHQAKSLFEVELPENPVFVVGSERFGMSESMLAQADMVVYIPVPGLTRSLNVTHAAAVLFFEWLRQMQHKFRNQLTHEV
jgi:tRNA G18 (ribose-2'-O)-methylase SpoU